MLTRLLQHVRQNLVAYLALFVALGGTSYAAVMINGRRIRNHTIDAVKLNPQTIAGSIRAWANLQFSSTGLTVVASSSRARVTTLSNGEILTWPNHRFGSHCVVMATPQLDHAPGQGPGYVTVDLLPPGHEVLIRGTTPAGTQQPESVFLMVVCP